MQAAGFQVADTLIHLSVSAFDEWGFTRHCRGQSYFGYGLPGVQECNGDQKYEPYPPDFQGAPVPERCCLGGSRGILRVGRRCGTGDTIVFTRSVDEDYELFSIRSDGSKLTRLTFTPGNDAHATCSPDGRWIAFSGSAGGFKDEAALHPPNIQRHTERFM